MASHRLPSSASCGATVVFFSCLLSALLCVSLGAAPRFAEDVYHRSRAETSPVGTLVVTVLAEDPDGDAVTYAIVNLTADNFVANSRVFSLAASSGQLRTVAQLDYERSQWYQMYISATDGSNTAYAQVFVLVTDSDDNAPAVRILEPSVSFHMDELPVHLSRTTKISDVDSILHPIRRVALTLRSYDGSFYPLSYGFCDNTTLNVFTDICGILLPAGASLTSWTLFGGAFVPPDSLGMAVTLSENQYGRRSLGSLYPLGYRFTVSAWLRQSSSLGGGFQYFFTHTSTDGGIRYHGLASLRNSNQFLFLYYSSVTGTPAHVYVYFSLEGAGALADDQLHFVALTVSLSNTSRVPASSITLQFDNFVFEAPTRIRHRSTDQVDLPPYMPEPSSSSSTLTQLGGRPNGASTSHHFIGTVAQLTFWKGITSTTSDRNCVLSCGDTLSFSSTEFPFGITGATFDRRTRQLVTQGEAPAGQLQPFLRSAQYNTRERPPTSRLVDFAATDTAQTGATSTLELLHDDIPRNFRPVIDLNGINLPGNYHEVQYLEDQAGGVEVVSLSAESPVVLGFGEITSLITYLQQINITLLPSALVNSTYERLSVDSSSPLPSSITASTSGLSLVLAGTSSTSVEDYRTAVRLVRYSNTAEEPDPGDRQIRFTLLNNGPYENVPVSVTTVTVVTQNDAPIVNANRFLPGNDLLLYTQDHSDPIDVLRNISITDTDSTLLEQFEINFDPLDGTFERYFLDATVLAGQNIERSDSMDGSGRFYLTGEASLEAYQTVLATLQWQNTKADSNTTTGFRNLTIRAYDNVGRSSDPVTVAIFFLSFDDPPIIELNDPSFDFATSYIEETPAIRLIPDSVNISDPDTHIAYVSIRLQNPGANPTTEELTFSMQSGPLPQPLVMEYDATAVQLTFRGEASTDVYQQTLRQVYYRSTLPEPDSSFVRVFEVWAVDTTNVSSREFRNVSSNVTVISLNDNNPLFDSDCSVRVFENLPVNDLVTVVNASDSDFGSDGVLTFTALQILPVDNFNLSSSTGNLFLASSLDFERYRMYTVNVNVTDGGAVPRFNETTCVIEVLDVNDNRPVLDLNRRDPANNNYMTLFVERNESIDLLAANNVVLFDVDTVSPLIHWVDVYLTNGGDGVFEFLMVPNLAPGIQVTNNGTHRLNFSGPAGNSSFASALERLVYVHTLSNPGNPSEHVRRVEFTASDGGLQSLVSTVFITFVTVNDVPVVDMNGDGGGRNFVTSYVDTDGSRRLPITDLSNGGLGLMDIDNVLMSEATLILSGVLDSGSELLEVIFNDPDITLDASSNNTYVRLVGRAREEQYKAVIDNITYVNSLDEPNPNGVRRVTLTITDGGHRDNASAARLTSEPVWTDIQFVIQNDHFPIFQGTPYVASVPENATTGVQALTVLATDLDAYFNTSVSYSIINDGTNNGVWSLDGSTGQITLAALASSGSGMEFDDGPLDYETQRMYSFVVEAQDNGNVIGFPRRATNVSVVINIIDLNDNTPQFQPADEAVSRSVLEDVPLSYVIFDFNATDRDDTSNSNLTYLIYPGSSQTLDGRLRLDPRSGVLSVVQALDREDVPTYSFRVMVRDAGVPPRRDLINVTITLVDVNDVAPAFDPANFTVSLDENSRPSDRQTSFTSALPLEANARWIPTLPTGTFTRQVRVGSGSSSSLQGTSTVLLCDMLTVTGSDVMLMEQVVLATSAAAQCFSGGTILFEQLVTMNLTQMQDPVLARFILSDSTLPVDWLGLYDIPITSSEKPYRELFTYFRNQTLLVHQRRARATSTYASALDGSDFNGAFACPLRSGSWSSSGMVNVPDDILSCSSNFTAGNLGATWDSSVLFAYTGNNEECTYLYGLSDELEPPLATRSDVTTVGMKVFVRHTCPSGNITCLQNSYDLNRCGNSQLSRGMRNSKARAPIDAYDRDLGANGQLVYSIRSGNDLALFEINDTTGVLELAMSLDYENRTEHSLVVEVRDRGAYPPEGLLYRSATASVQITVNDINDNAPQFESDVYTETVDENTAVGTTVLTVTATDRDSTTNGFLRYTIGAARQILPSGAMVSEALDNTTFSLVTRNVSSTQVVDIIVQYQNLDFERVRSFNYTLWVYDHGTPILSDTTLVVIDLQDLNDNRPIITVQPLAANHLEDESGVVDTQLFLSVNISDADTVPLMTPPIQGVRITVSSRGTYTANEEYLSLRIRSVPFRPCTDGGGQGSQGREILLEGAGTQDQYEDVLRTLFYENTAEEFLYNDTATITIYITDEPSVGGTGSCSFQRNRNFTSVVLLLPLQEVNDRPVYMGPSSLLPLPTIIEDVASSQNLGVPVWTLLDGRVTDNDDIDSNAVYGIALTGVNTSIAMGTFEYTNQQQFSGSSTSQSFSAVASLTLAYDSSVTLQVALTYSTPVSVDRIEFRTAGSSIGLVNITWTNLTHYSASFTPNNTAGERVRLLTALNASLLDVYLFNDTGTRLSTVRMALVQPLVWRQVREDSSSNMAALIGSGGRFRFLPNEHANGIASATFLAWDQRDGSVGTNVFDTSSSTSVSLASTSISVTVLAVNDPPFIRLSGAAGLNFSTTFVENIDPVAIVNPTGLTVDDVENDPIVSVLVNIYGETSAVCNSSQECPGFERATPNLDRVFFTANDLFEVGIFNVTGTICKTWNITTFHVDPSIRGTTESNWQAFLRTAQFFNQHPEPYDHIRIVEFVGFDGKAYGPPAYARINVMTFNDNEPQVANSGTIGFVEENPCSAVGVDFSVVDPDCAATILWAQIGLENEPDANTRLEVNASGSGLQVTYGSSLVYINGSASVENYQSVVRSLTYYNLALEPAPTTRTLSVQVRGRVAESDVFRFPLVPRLISDNPPTLWLNGNQVNTTAVFTENSESPVQLVMPSRVNLTDLDLALMVTYSVEVSITDAQDGLNETLSLPSPSSVGVPDDSVLILRNGSSSINITSLSATNTQFLTVLASITYLNTAEQPQGAPMRTVSYTLLDRDALTGLPRSTPCGDNPLIASPPVFFATAFCQVFIAPRNDLPVIQLDSSNPAVAQLSVDFDEGGPPIRLTALNGGTIIDLDNTTLEYMEVALFGVRDGVDEAILANVSGTSISVTVNSTAMVRFDGPDTVSNFIFVLNSLRYSNVRFPQPTNGSRNATIVVSDGLGLSAAVELLIAVDIFNNNPILDLNGPEAGRGNRVNFFEGGSDVFLAPVGTIVDTDSQFLGRMEVILSGIEVIRQETLVYDMNAVVTGITCEAGCSPDTPNVVIPRALFTSSSGVNVSAWQALMRTFRYQNRDDELNGTSRSVVFNVTDDKLKDAQQITTVVLNNVEDRPTLDLDRDSSGADYVVPNDGANILLEGAPLGTGVSIVNEIIDFPATTAMGEAATVASTVVTTMGPRGNVSTPPPVPPPSPPSNVTGFVTTQPPTTPATTPTMTPATTPTTTPTTPPTTIPTTTPTTPPTTIPTTTPTTPPTTTPTAPPTTTPTTPPTTTPTTPPTTTPTTPPTTTPTTQPTTTPTTPPTTIPTTIPTTRITSPTTTPATTPTTQQPTGTIPDEVGRRRRQVQNTLGEAPLDTTQPRPTTTVPPATTAAQTMPPTTPAGTGSSQTMATVDVGTTQAIRVPQTFQPITTTVTFGQRGFSLRDSDSVILLELDIFIKSVDSQFETFDVNNAVSTSLGTSSRPVPSLFGNALNRTFPSSAVVESIRFTELTGESVATLLRFFISSDCIVFCFSIANGTVQQYEDLLGRLRYRNSAPEPCCPDPPNSETVTRSLQVFASDNGQDASNVAMATVTINLLNDNPPNFTADIFHALVFENSTLGSTIIRILATDADNSELHNNITYNVVNSQIFRAVKAPDGSADIVLGQVLNRESTANHLLNVSAFDGLNYAFATVNITVLDTNDNSPEFSNFNATPEVLEGQDGALVTSFVITDRDEGLNGQVMVLVLEPALGPFAANNTELRVAAGSSLDRETQPMWFVTLIATDRAGSPNGRSSRLQINVTVTDINDNVPVFSPAGPASISLAENTTTATSVFQVQATDRDIGTNAAISFHAVAGSSPNFAVNLTSGVISLVSSLDYESSARHNVIIEARNPQLPIGAGNYREFSLTINVTDVNDNDPTFLGLPYAFVATENSPHFFGSVRAMDADSQNTITYTVIQSPSDNSDLVAVNSTGALSPISAISFDRESTPNITFSVSATDSGSPPRSSVASVFVSLTDVNDNPPIFMPATYSEMVQESVARNTTVFTVTATDRDIGVNSEIRFSLLTHSDLFQIDPVSGVVQVASTLDFDPPTNHRTLLVEVMAEDQGSPTQSSMVTAIVAVQDVNDNDPQFARSLYTAAIPENAVNEFIVDLGVGDIDSGVNGQLFFNVSGIGAENFAVNASGVLFTSRGLDRENVAVHNLTVFAFDRGQPQRWASAVVVVTVIDVNDFTPVFIGDPYLFPVAEDTSVDAGVGAVVAQDNDTLVFSRISYTLIGSAGPFVINSSTGAVSLTQALDYEVTRPLVYALQVEASDSLNTRLATITFNITDVDDHFPVIALPATVNISETQSGAFFTVQGSDGDGTAQFNTFRFSLVNDSVHQPGAFEVRPDSGEVFRVQDLTSGNFPVTSIGIRACGGVGLCSSIGRLEIGINRAPQVQARFMFAVHENSPPFVPVGVVVATDPNCGGNTVPGCVNFVIEPNLFFTINANGTVYTTMTPVNREQMNMHNLTVSVSDNGVGATTVQTTIIIAVLDRNDVPPCFEATTYRLTAPENENNFQVALLQTTDTDEGMNALIAATELSGPMNDHFYAQHYINGSVAIFTNRRLDRENISIYNLTLQAIDMGAMNLSCSSTLIINVTDVNDNCPRFSLNGSRTVVSVNEFAPLGFTALSFQVTDADSGSNAQVTVTFNSSDQLHQAFRLSASQDGLLVNRSLDPESALGLPRQYNLMLVATDGSQENPCTTLHDVQVLVSDVNDNCPMGNNQTSTVVVEELDQPQFVAFAPFTDPDFGPNGRLTYSISPLSDGFLNFTINPNTSEIRSVGRFDRERQEVYNVIVVAQDNPVNTSQRCSGSALVQVIIQDINDQNPVFSQPNFTFSVLEDAPLGTPVGSINATDADIGSNAELTFSIAGEGTPAATLYFSIADTGAILVAGSLDRERDPQGLRYIVTARDRGNASLSSSVLVVINMLDVNDERPVLDRTAILFLVPESTPAGATVATITATDADIGSNANLTYMLVTTVSRDRSGALPNLPAPGFFSVGRFSGQVILNQSIDYDTTVRTVFEVTIIAVDMGSPSLTSLSAQYVVSVTDVNDNPPVFDQSVFNISVREDAPTGFVLANLSATDPDVGANLFFLLESARGPNGQRFSAFTVSVSSGQVSLGSVGVQPDLDYELSTVVIVTVRVTDGLNSNTATLNLFIIDVNDNVPEHLSGIQFFNINENRPANATINTGNPLLVVDRDGTAPNNVFDLHIVASTFSDRFSVDNSGIIRQTRPLDAENSPQFYSLVINATDRGQPPLSSRSTNLLAIFVTDVNDNTPEFSASLYQASISESSSVGTAVVNVSATDNDLTGANNVMAFQLTQSNPTFAISTTSPTGGQGRIQTNTLLDRESVDSYFFSITVVDSGNPVLSSQANVSVTITDVDDNRPVISTSDTPRPVFIEGGSFILPASDGNITDPDLLSIHPVTQLRAWLTTSTGAGYPNYGGECLQKPVHGAGRGTELPYSDALDMCGIPSSVNLLSGMSTVCGVRQVAFNFPIFLINGTETVATNSAPQLDSNSSFSFWFRSASPTTLLSRYHNGSVSLLVEVTATAFAVQIGYDTQTLSGDNVIFPASSALDGSWHHVLLYISSGITVEMTFYLDGVSLTDSQNRLPTQLQGTVGDIEPRELFVGGTQQCLSGFVNAEISLLLQASAPLPRNTDVPCCVASCGNRLRYNGSSRHVSVVANCARRSLTISTQPSLPNSDSLQTLASVLRNLSFTAIPDEILVPNQTLALSAADTVGFGASHQLPVLATSVNDRNPELYIGGREILNFTATFTEDSGIPVSLVEQTSSALIDRDTCESIVSSVLITILNPGSPSNSEALSVAAQVSSSLSATVGSNGKTLRLEASAGSSPTYSDFLTAIRSIQYINIEDEPAYMPRIIEFAVNDSQLLNNPRAYARVNLVAVNDVPDLDLNPSPAAVNNVIAFQEDSPAIQIIDDGATIVDSDNTSMSRAVLNLTTTDPDDMLLLNTSIPIAAAIQNSGFVRHPSGTGGYVIFSGTASISDYLLAMRAVLYINRAGNPPSAVRRVWVVVSDGLAESAARAVDINLAAVNDIPLLDLNGQGVVGTDFTTTFTESGPCVHITSAEASITDVDSTALNQIQFVLNTRPDVYGESLQLTPSFSLPAGIVPSVRNMSTSIALFFDGVASLQDYTNIMTNITYCNILDEPTAAVRQVTVQARDSNNASSLETQSNINIQLVNDPPVLVAAGNPVFVDADGSNLVPLLTSATISDPDNTNMARISVYLQTSYQQNEGALSTAAALNPSIQDTRVGNNYSLDFDLSISNAVNLLLNLTYGNPNAEPSVENRILCVAVSDGQALSNTICVTLTVQLTNDNDPSIVSALPNRTDVMENLASVTVSEIIAADADRGIDGQLTFAITAVSSQQSFTDSIQATSGIFGLLQTSASTARINLTQPLNAEEYVAHNITVSVTDQGSPTRSVQTIIYINVVDVNDVSPVFSSTLFDVSVSEGLSVGDTVTTVIATDSDVAAPNTVLQFFLLASAATFSIDNAGVVRLLQPLNFYNQQQYTFGVEVRDGGTPQLNATSTIQVTVILPQPCFENATTQTWTEGTRSQALSPGLTLGCRSRAATVSSATITLPTSPSCPGQNLCQLTQRLPACELDEANFPVTRVMDIARGQFENADPPPADASCQGSAVTLSQQPGQRAAATLPAGTIPDLVAGDNFTISARVRLEIAASHREMLFSINRLAEYRIFAIYLINFDLASRTLTDPFNNMWVYYYTASGRRQVEFTNVFLYDGNYHQFSLTVSNSLQRMYLYVDCVFRGSVQMGGQMVWDSTLPVYVGRRDGSDNFNYDGVIDDIIIQRRFWTQENINCMCSDANGRDAINNCGEMVERPSIDTPLTSSLTNTGRTLTLSGNFGYDVYEAALRSISYRYIAPITQDLSRSVTFSITDDRSNSGSNASSISIVNTNTTFPPTLLLNGVDQNISILYDEGMRPISRISSSLTLDDLDSSNLASATVMLVGHNTNAGEVLSFDSSVASAESLTATLAADSSSITLTASGVGRPLSNFEAVLRTVTYAVTGPAGVLCCIQMRSVVFAVTDVGQGLIASVTTTSVLTINIQVASNRNPPVITGIPTPLARQTPVQSLAPSALISDSDIPGTIRGVNIQITSRPSAIRSPITGLTCERYAPLVIRASVCTARSDILDLLQPVPPAVSPVAVNTSVADGNVAVFDGLASHLSIPSSNHDFTGFDLSTFTISVWFRQASNNFGYVLSLTDSSGENYFISIYSRGDLTPHQIWLRLPQGTDTTFVTFTLTGNIDDGNWHHLVVSFANPSVTLFVDGLSQGTVTAPVVANLIVPSNYRFYVGGRPRITQPEFAVFRLSGEVAGLQFWPGDFPAAQLACYLTQCLPSLSTTVHEIHVATIYSESALLLQLAGTPVVTFGDLQSVLRSLQYTNEFPASGNRTITYTATDSILSSTTTQVLTN